MQSLIKIENNYVSFDFSTKPGQQIKIVGTYDDPYFCGKDVCDILEYKRANDALRDHVKPKYKKDLQTILKELVGVSPTNSILDSVNFKNISYHNGKVIYISEPGLYSLIMKSKTSFAETFQDFVYEQILPSIRKKGRFQLEQQLEQKEQTIALKDDKIDKLTALVEQMDIRLKGISFQNDELLSRNSELLSRNDDLLSRNDDLLENVEDLKITSVQQTVQLEKVQTALGIAVETRAPLPKSSIKRERFILLKRSQKRNGLRPEYQYYTIRAQNNTAKQSLKTQETMYNVIILLDLDCHPNSRSLYNRIKEELCKQKVVFSYNNISIEGSDIDEDVLIERMKSIDDQKRDV